MRIGFVFHRLGPFVMGLGFIMGIPLVISLLYHEPDTLSFAISGGVAVAAGACLHFLVRHGENSLSRHEALLLVPLVWLSAALFGALPYLFAGVFTSFHDAFFESMSGFTTTGASVMITVEDKTHGILFWRSLTQWLGGVGIVMLFVAIFPTIGVGAAHAVESELTGPKTERLTARIRDTAKILWEIYAGLSLLEVIALLVAGLSLYDALVFTMSTMPGGGFAPYDKSVGFFNSIPVELIITFFMVAAGINFQLYYFIIWKRLFRTFLADRELRTYLAILGGSIILVSANLVIQSGSSIGQAVRHATFTVASIQTTTGFATADSAVWPALSRAILIILMVIGSSASSTSGALKVSRIIILIKYAYRQILLAFSPRAVYPMKLGKKIVSESVVSETVGISLLYMGVLVAGTLVISTLGLDPLIALSAAAAAMGNVGPGLGPVGPMGNYAFIPVIGKVVLSMLMLIGRLEVIAVLVLFTPSFWRARGKSRPQAQSRLPAWRN